MFFYFQDFKGIQIRMVFTSWPCR